MKKSPITEYSVIRCQISHSGFLVQGFAMAGSGIMGAPRSSSRSMYYTPLHAWGLPDVPDEFTPEELAENTRNEDDLRSVLRPIQAFSEYYWVRVPRRRVDRFHRGYLEPEERPASARRRRFFRGTCLRTSATF